MCMCVLCTMKICWASWRGSHVVDFWQHWMLQVITCDPLIPSFISCNPQTLCNHAPPFHPLSFHLITSFLMLLCIFPLFSTFETIEICVFHMEITLWVHLSTLRNNYPQFVSSTWSLHCGLWKVSSSWWREK
jgi:hypothetical protein